MNERSKKEADLISALLCVVCGVGAAVRVHEQTFCGRCAIDYQVSRVGR